MSTPKPLSKRQSHRKLSDEQKAILLAAMSSEEFHDQPPREVYGALLSRGEYHCSWRTMYRVLGEQGPMRERRNQRKARSFAIPRLESSARFKNDGLGNFAKTDHFSARIDRRNLC